MVGCMPTGDIRIWDRHPFETKEQYKKITIYSEDGSIRKQFNAKVSFEVPAATGVKNLEPSSANRGVVFQRGALRRLDNLQIATKGETATAKEASMWLALQQTCEVNSPGVNNMCKEIKAASGLDVHDRKPRGKIQFHVNVDHLKRQCRAIQREPTITLEKLNARQVKCRTGFCNVAMLLSFLVTVCDGDVTKMKRTVSYLTCLE